MKTNIWNLLFDRLIRFIQSDYPRYCQIQKTVKKGGKRIEQEYGSHLYQYASGFFNRTIFVTAETRDHQRWNNFPLKF